MHECRSGARIVTCGSSEVLGSRVPLIPGSVDSGAGQAMVRPESVLAAVPSPVAVRLSPDDRMSVGVEQTPLLVIAAPSA